MADTVSRASSDSEVPESQVSPINKLSVFNSQGLTSDKIWFVGYADDSEGPYAFLHESCSVEGVVITVGVFFCLFPESRDIVSRLLRL